MARAKAYLFGGVEIRWQCAPSLLDPDGKTPAEAVFHFPGGLKDYLAADIEGKELVAEQFFVGKRRKAERPRLAGMGGRLARSRTTASSIPIATPFRRRTAARMKRACALALLRGLKDHAERIGQAQARRRRSPPTTSWPAAPR